MALGIPFAAVILWATCAAPVFFLTGLLGIEWFALFLHAYRRAARKTGEPSLWAHLLRYRTACEMMLGNAAYLYMYYVLGP